MPAITKSTSAQVIILVIFLLLTAIRNLYVLTFRQ
jgi:hypothetical protein